MELQLVTFEQAKALKELGFPQRAVSSIGWYSTNGQLNNSSIDAPLDLLEGECYASTLELVSKWLRDEKGLIVEVNYTYDDTYHWSVIQKKQPSKMKQYGVIPLTDNRTYQNTYEEALSAGIDKAIEILKEK